MTKAYLALEKYLVLYPDGDMRWIHCQREDMCKCFRESIGCDTLENVTLPYGFCCVVDESGKMKDPPQPFNELASRFYPGTPYGDPLVGPVVFCRIGLIDGEHDWVPLTAMDLAIIELITGKQVPR